MATNYPNEESDHQDESLSLSDLPITLIKHRNSHFLHEQKPTAVNTPIAAADDDDEDFDFGSIGGFSNSAVQPPPQMCFADDVFYQGQLLPARLSVSSDNSSAGFYRRNGFGSDSIGKFKSINSSGSSNCRSQCSSAAKNTRPRVSNFFHSHPSPKPQIKAPPTTFRQASTGSQKSSSAWDFVRLGVVKAPGMELQDLKHRSSTRRNSSVSRSNSGRGIIIPIADGGCGGTSIGSSVKEMLRIPGARASIERKSGGILSGVGCKCSVDSTVVPETKEMVVRRRNENSKNIPARAMTRVIREKAIRELRMKKIEKEKEEEKKLELSRHRTFEWVKELSHVTFPCEA